MTYLAHIENGVIVLDSDVVLPEGARVEISIMNEAASETQGSHPTHAEMFGNMVGALDGLPPDLAKNHDHYLHGKPKK